MKLRKRKCKCCRLWFMPQAHNAYHQRYCSSEECQRASHRASQRRWLRHNPDYNRGSDQVQRVQHWRRLHPGYWRNAIVETIAVIFRRRPLSRRTYRLHVKAEHRKTGALRDLFFVQQHAWQPVAVNVNHALRDFIGVSVPNVNTRFLRPIGC